MKKTILLLMLSSTFALNAQKWVLNIKIKPEVTFSDNAMNNETQVKNILINCPGIYKIRQSYPNAKTKELLYFYTLEGQQDMNESVDRLSKNEYVQSIEKDQIAFTSSCVSPSQNVNDSLVVNGISNNYALDLIEANCAWSISTGHPHILLGIADTDFEGTHEDLENQFERIHGSVSGGAAHGTLVSGVACAETNNNLGIPSIGYNSKIAAQRIVHTANSDGIGASTSASNIRDAIWALYLDGIRIINVSWTSTGLVEAAAREIAESGVVLTLAAGNSPASTDHSSIADIPGVINVSSVDVDNNHVSFHAHNQWVDICAPGEAVYTTFHNNSYGLAGGTSLAAPFVAGTVALMLEVNPCLSSSEIETLIKESADSVADEASYPGLLGAGRLNVYKSVKKAGTRVLYDMNISGNKIFSAGYGLYLSEIIIDDNSEVIFSARKEIEIKNNFEVPIGSTMILEIDSNVRTNCNQLR